MSVKFQERLRTFQEWLRTTPFMDRVLTETEYRSLIEAMNEAYEHQMDFKLFDHLHQVIAKPDTCPTCGDERCGCQFHQQSCSHIVNAYMQELYEARQRGETF